MDWQLYWRKWWRLYPWWVKYPEDEDGSAEFVFGFGPLQIRKYVWRRK